MPLKLFANQFSTETILATSTPPNDFAFSFSFNAKYVRVSNLSTVPMHVNFATTCAASTGDPELPAGATIEFRDITCFGGGVMTTSTTTSTGDDGHRVTVAAWGA